MSWTQNKLVERHQSYWIFAKNSFFNVYFSNNRIQLLTSLGSLFVPCSSLSLTVSCVYHHSKIDSVNKWFKCSDCWENPMQQETGSHVPISVPGNSLMLPLPYSNAFWKSEQNCFDFDNENGEGGVHFSWNIISTYMKHNQPSSV